VLGPSVADPGRTDGFGGLVAAASGAPVVGGLGPDRPASQGLPYAVLRAPFLGNRCSPADGARGFTTREGQRLSLGRWRWPLRASSGREHADQPPAMVARIVVNESGTGISGEARPR
jgi:hypothetical protein